MGGTIVMSHGVGTVAKEITKKTLGAITVHLDYPIKVAGEFVSELSLRRPKAKELMAMDEAKGETAKSIHLIAAISDIPPSSAENIDFEDLEKIGKVLEDFKKKPKDGKKKLVQ